MSADNKLPLRTVSPEEIQGYFLHALTMIYLAAGSPDDLCALEDPYGEVLRRVGLGLHDWWPEVEAVATRLIEAESLDEAQISAAIERAGREG
jgi:hypothetical protein